MKITIYTVKDCEFSKQEKDYLTAKNLPFEEKDLEANRESLTEMLAISNNFSGTPVSKIEKDDGQIVVLKGFTKEDFDKIFEPNAVATTAPTTAQTAAPAVPAAPEPVVMAPSADVPPTPPQPVPTPPTPTEPTLPPIEDPAPPVPMPSAPVPIASPAPAIDPLHSILSDLQAKSQSAPTVVQPPTANMAQPAAPTIPDFPQS